MFLPLADIMHITSQRLAIRKAWEDMDYKPRRSVRQVQNQLNLATVASAEGKKTNVSGLVTRKVRLRMNRILDAWLRSLRYADKDRRGRAKHLPTFCTLTLPAKQMHKDSECHKMLNYFITESWQGYGGKRFTYYLWRAERQKNGNIHYHIVFDAYIDWEHIRSKWNKILSRYGYIDAYNKNNPGSINRDNPNSTDIHSLRTVKDVTAYIIKYCTKESEEGQKINGRVWGCSKELKTVKEARISSHEMSFDAFAEEVLQDAKRVEEYRKQKNPNARCYIQNEQVTIIYSKRIPEILNKYPRLKQRVIQHYRELYLQLYAPEKIITKKDKLDQLFVLPGVKGKDLKKHLQPAIDFEF